MKYEALKARLRTVGYFATDEDAKEAAYAIDALEAALDKIAKSTGCVDACPCWKDARNKASKAMGAVL